MVERIFIVDDVEIVRRDFANKVKELGWKEGDVFVFSSEAEAMQAIEMMEAGDIVFLDVNLGREDKLGNGGLKVAKAIRKKHGDAVKIVGISSRDFIPEADYNIEKFAGFPDNLGAVLSEVIGFSDETR